MREGLNERAGQLDRVVKDYAWWNEAVEAIQRARIATWAEARLGSYLYGTHEYDWAFVIAPDGSTFHAALEGETVGEDITAALGNEHWRLLVEQSRAAIIADEPYHMHAYVPMRDGRLGIASASAIVAETSWPDPTTGRSALCARRGAQPDAGVVVGTRRRAQSRRSEFQPFAPTCRRPGCSWRDPTGCAVGSVSWQARRPGTEYLVALAPSLGVAMLLFVAFGWSALRQSRSSTQAIVESEDRFRDVADASSDWIFETDADGRVTWISERFIALTGIPLGDIEGKPITELLLPMAGEDLSAELDEAMREQRLFRSIPRCYLDLEGRPRALRVSGKPNRDAAGRHLGWRGTATDVTVEIEARKTAEFLSGHDALTGILNRQGLIEGTTELLEAATAPQPARRLPAARPRPVQGGQRRPWPDRRRPADPGHRPEAGQPGAAGRRDRPPRRRRVRAGPSRPSSRRRRCIRWPSPSRMSWRSHC